ncbi:MAG: O-antigen ligase family protein [Myxococcaceae bacterium]|nr:O-antigen ligase family protein [Myxococcaceae bacterium]
MASVVAALVCTLTSASVVMSLPAFVLIVTYAAWAMVASPFAPRPLLIAAWPIAVYAFLQRLGLDPVAWNAHATWNGEVRPFSTLGHPGQLAGWLAVVLPFALDEWVAQSQRRRLFAIASTLVIVFTLLITLSRAGWLATLAGAAVWATFQWRVWTRQRTVVTTVTVLIIMVASLELEWVRTRVQSFFVIPTRWQLAESAMSAFIEHPWLGFGLDTFTLVSQRHGNPNFWTYEWGATPQHAHALLPQVAATMGTLGLLVLVVFAVLIARSLARHLGQPSVPPAVIGATAAFIVGALLFFHGVATTALGIGCIAQLLQRDNAPAKLPHWKQVSSLALALVILVSASWLSASIAARRAMELKPAAAASPWFTWAERFDPLNARWSALKGAAFESEARAGNATSLQPARTAFERARNVEPRIAQYWANLGRVAATAGDTENALSAFQQAVLLAPGNARVQLDFAEALLRMGRLEEADKQLPGLVAQWPSWGPAWWALAVLRSRQGRQVEERAALEAALRSEWYDWPAGADVARTRLDALRAAEAHLPERAP